VTFGFVPFQLVEGWGEWRKLLQPAVDLAGTNWTEVEEALEVGSAQLWIETEPAAALISRRFDDELEIWLCAGRVLNAADQWLATIENAARSAGMARMVLTGRKGWERHLRKWGWTRNGENIVKDLI
jgi:hypothetical protein